jgi:hypothetical protein
MKTFDASLLPSSTAKRDFFSPMGYYGQEIRTAEGQVTTTSQRPQAFGMVPGNGPLRVERMRFSDKQDWRTFSTYFPKTTRFEEVHE